MMKLDDRKVEGAMSAEIERRKQKAIADFKKKKKGEKKPRK